ncbi:MAG: flagellar protein FlaG [Candidatus Sulfopaludibacter sp.]|nr:flagellar protein FlaG [Candidatus Sulfopaludibacter sp.]
MNRSTTSAPASVPPAPAEQQTQNREVIQAVKALNSTEMFGENNELRFQKDPQTHRMIVRIVDRKTQEVLSQIPPEYVLALAAESKTQKV